MTDLCNFNRSVCFLVDSGLMAMELDVRLPVDLVAASLHTTACRLRARGRLRVERHVVTRGAGRLAGRQIQTRLFRLKCAYTL